MNPAYDYGLSTGHLEPVNALCLQFLGPSPGAGPRNCNEYTVDAPLVLSLPPPLAEAETAPGTSKTTAKQTSDGPSGRAGESEDTHLATLFTHFTDTIGRLSGGKHLISILLRTDQDHANPHVEGPVKFVGRNVASR